MALMLDFIFYIRSKMLIKVVQLNKVRASIFATCTYFLC